MDFYSNGYILFVLILFRIGIDVLPFSLIPGKILASLFLFSRNDLKSMCANLLDSSGSKTRGNLAIYYVFYNVFFTVLIHEFYRNRDNDQLK